MRRGLEEGQVLDGLGECTPPATLSTARAAARGRALGIQFRWPGTSLRSSAGYLT